jgi:hypothetical protein
MGRELYVSKPGTCQNTNRRACYATLLEFGLKCIVCFATSSEHDLQCIEGLVASQPPRNMVLIPLKGWLLRNLLGVWPLTSSMHSLQCISTALSHPFSHLHTPTLAPSWFLQIHSLPTIRTETESTHYAGQHTGSLIQRCTALSSHNMIATKGSLFTRAGLAPALQQAMEVLILNSSYFCWLFRCPGRC